MTPRPSGVFFPHGFCPSCLELGCGMPAELVCAACGSAACWAGELLCEDARSAGVVVVCGLLGPAPIPGGLGYRCTLPAGHDRVCEAWVDGVRVDSWFRSVRPTRAEVLERLDRSSVRPGGDLEAAILDDLDVESEEDR